MIRTWKERKIVVDGQDYYPFKDVLIFDIETAKKDTNKGVYSGNSDFRIFGAYSYNTGKLTYATKNNFQKLIDEHRILVGHNIKGFDIPVLEKELSMDFRGKIMFDILEILRKPPSKAEKEAMEKKGKKPNSGKGRAAIIGELLQQGMIDNRFPDLKMATIVTHGNKIFGDNPKYKQYWETTKQEDFDYSILQPENITEENWLIIKEYLRRDIVVTKNIFEFLEKYFESFAQYLPSHDIKKLEYVRSATGSYAYKAICKELKLEEDYGESGEGFTGAYVFLPTQEEYNPADGDGYCIDFNSQHPSHVRMMNLCTPTNKCNHKVEGKCPTAYKGDGEIFNLIGEYCRCEQGKIEKLITKWYLQRLEYKKIKDPREYTIKILINATYGILSSSVFKSIYNPTTGPDTTRMSQQSTKFMSKWMRLNGYIVTYGDTDSLYIMDPFKDKDKMQKIINEGIDKIKATLPFADEHYQMGIDAEFSHIFYFEDDDDKAKKFKKKNYIYITQEGKVKLLGLPILKRNAPKLAKTIYLNYLEKQISNKRVIKFDKEYIRQLVRFEIGKGINILAVNTRVNPASSYASPNSLNAQISEKYFEGKDGIFTGIKHLRKGFGVGKGVHYCTLEEAKRLGFHEYDLTTLWKVLKPFIKEDKQLRLGDFK